MLWSLVCQPTIQATWAKRAARVVGLQTGTVVVAETSFEQIHEVLFLFQLLYFHKKCTKRYIFLAYLGYILQNDAFVAHGRTEIWYQQPKNGSYRGGERQRYWRIVLQTREANARI